jgi:GNAT superfamily N-acetyltransferase
MSKPKKPTFTWHPLTPDRFSDLQTLFGPHGACGGCWCMTWRLSRQEFHEGKGATNEARFHLAVMTGPPPGVLLYHEHEPVAWCAIAPREDYPALERSRVMARVDDQPVWSVSCFFVRKDWRGKGLTVELLDAATEFAKSQGATIVEGYPSVTSKRYADAFVWTGLDSAFIKAGFAEAVKRSPARKIMRKYLTAKAGSKNGAGATRGSLAKGPKPAKTSSQASPKPPRTPKSKKQEKEN